MRRIFIVLGLCIGFFYSNYSYSKDLLLIVRMERGGVKDLFSNKDKVIKDFMATKVIQYLKEVGCTDIKNTEFFDTTDLFDFGSGTRRTTISTTRCNTTIIGDKYNILHIDSSDIDPDSNFETLRLCYTDKNINDIFAISKISVTNPKDKSAKAILESSIKCEEKIFKKF